MMDQQPKVSIIIPVHNAGCYFEKCLTSLINQTLKEIEIILVLDCPTDGSDKVAEEFASKDSRIRLIYNKENLHTGLSRNRGMDIAQGKYIGFHDHDDYSDPDMYELLYKKAEQEDMEVVRCNFYCIYAMQSGNNKEEYKYPEVSTDISNRGWVYENVSNNNISCVIWNHIYKADFLKQHGIRFLDSRSICSEDSIFFIEVYHRVNRLGIIPDYLYYHVFHTNNTGKIYDYRSIKNRISFFEVLYSFLKRNGIGEEKCCFFLSQNAARSLYSGSRQALSLLSLNKALAEIRPIRNNELMMNIINYLYRKNNRSALFQLKPTIIVFFFIMKLSGRKQFK